MVFNAILFDMDSTLNRIDEIAFSRKYFKMLHEKYFNDFDPQFFFESLTDITKTVMLSNLPKELTFKSFVREMSKSYKRSPKVLIHDLKEFYENDYNELESYIQPAENANDVVQSCLDKELDVIIATTPIFPEIAIMKRLEWSGMGNYHFKLITHAENMYYSKPREEYYTEIMKKIKRKSIECLMVGNEFMGDVVSPSRVGIKTFYCPQETINDDLYISPELKRFNKINPTYTGTLKDLYKLINNGFLK